MAKSKMTTCKHCGAEIAASAKVCPQCGGKTNRLSTSAGGLSPSLF